MLFPNTPTPPRHLLHHCIFPATDCTHVTNKPLLTQTRRGIYCTSGILSSGDLLTNNQATSLSLAESTRSDFFSPGSSHQSQGQVIWYFSKMRDITHKQVSHSSYIQALYQTILLDYGFLLFQIDPKEDAVIHRSKTQW